MSWERPEFKFSLSHIVFSHLLHTRFFICKKMLITILTGFWWLNKKIHKRLELFNAQQLVMTISIPVTNITIYLVKTYWTDRYPPIRVKYTLEHLASLALYAKTGEWLWLQGTASRRLETWSSDAFLPLGQWADAWFTKDRVVLAIRHIDVASYIRARGSSAASGQECREN